MTEQHTTHTTNTAAAHTTPATPASTTTDTPPTGRHRRTRAHLTLIPTPTETPDDNRAGHSTTTAVLFALGLAATAGILTNATAAATTALTRPEAAIPDQDQTAPAPAPHKAATHKATPTHSVHSTTNAAAWHPHTVVAAAYTVPITKPTGRHRRHDQHSHHATPLWHGHGTWDHHDGHHRAPRHAKPGERARIATA